MLLTASLPWEKALFAAFLCSDVQAAVIWTFAFFVMGTGLLCLLCFAAGLIIFVCLMLSLRGVTQRDLKSIPGGGVFLAVGRFLRFM